ncbi:MAG: acyl-CoA dehydrogenase family protein, partial [Stackebrandtia sp.]
MTHYKSNLRDLEFNLFEVFDTASTMGHGLYSEIDADTARDILREVTRIAENDLAAPFAEADRNPPVFDPSTNTVELPDSFKKAYRTMMDSEYWRLDVPPALGGTNAPRTLWWAFADLVLGANPALWMYAAGPSFAHTLEREGTEEQRNWAKLFADKQWGATMVLTEP